LAKATLSDVARLAGVSAATVSRALAHPDLLRRETLMRVHEAVEKLGYVADGAARALASRRSHTIGAVIPSLENAIFATTVFAMQKVLDANGYSLVVSCNEYDLDTEVRLTRKLIERGVDALVLVGTQHRPELFGMLERFRVPYVFTWAYDESETFPCVGFNHRKATARVTRHLIDEGHRHFAVISTITRDNERARDRLAGVLDLLDSEGLRPSADRVIEKPFSFLEGQSALQRVMQGEPKPSAVICLNDVLAIGAISAARAMGLNIPGDVSITGCEDLEVAAVVSPGLTTVRYPTVEMGHYAGEYVLAALTGRTVPVRQVFPTKLIVRGSTCPPASREQDG